MHKNCFLIFWLKKQHKTEIVHFFWALLVLSSVYKQALISQHTLCRPAWWELCTIKCGSAPRTRSSTSSTQTPWPATNSWLNTGVKWRPSQWTPSMNTTGRRVILNLSRASKSIKIVLQFVKEAFFSGLQSVCVLLQQRRDHLTVELLRAYRKETVPPHLWSTLLHSGSWRCSVVLWVLSLQRGFSVQNASSTVLLNVKTLLTMRAYF